MKKTYFQPAVEVAQVAIQSIICASAAANNSGAGKVNPNVPTDEQW